MPSLRISNGTLTNDIELSDSVPSGKHIQIGNYYLPLSETKPSTFPTLKLNDGVTDYYPGGGRIFDISIGGNWTPYAAFSYVFELLDDNGNVVTTATPDIKKYRVKDSWYDGSVTNITKTLSDSYVLESIELPSSWGSIKFADTLLEKSGVKSIIFPSSWGGVRNTRLMCRRCSRLVSITMPSDWGYISDVYHMFYGTGFTSKAPGILVSPGYYRSPADGVFPSECYRDDLGLPF